LIRWYTAVMAIHSLLTLVVYQISRDRYQPGCRKNPSHHLTHIGRSLYWYGYNSYLSGCIISTGGWGHHLGDLLPVCISMAWV